MGPTSAMPGGEPVAASTAARAFTMPAPHCEQALGKCRVVLCKRKVTSSGLSVGFTESIKATTPDTCGVAIDVP